MALEGLDQHGIGGNSRTWRVLLVRVDTDEGVYGLGEAPHLQASYMGVREAIACIRERLLGTDPFAIRPIASDMLYGGLPPHWPGSSPGGVGVGSIVWGLAGVEMALCDLVGKALGTPIYNLLGGKFRDRLRVYLDRSAPHDLDDLGAWKALAADAKARGFTDIKFDADYAAVDHRADLWNRSIPLPELNAIIERLTAVREAAGPDMEISLDCHEQYDAPSATRLARALEPLHLKWLEDPTPIVNPGAMARVRAESPIPICGGEWCTADQFKVLIDAGACDIVHPDVLFTGGLTETRRIADYADLHGIPLALHNNSSGLGVIASAHVAAASRNFIGLEYHFFDAPWIGEVLDRGGAPLFEDGHIVLPDAPGLGGVLNEDVCREHLAPGERMF